MTNINTDKLIHSCVSLSHRICTIEGGFHSSSWIFDQCMRAFDKANLPAEAITFRVYLNAPVMKYGFVTIHRDGSMELSIDKDSE